ncbi:MULTISPECIES: restriction endonuclease subunit S [Halomonadaceae]|jgi:type I restriction enzyme S subunit|uniref:restriction endonuclease subunit S n=1 Tax=Halomonadaceae TaxID=28256 RepID=UPI001D17317B|nr:MULTISPECIES: restriction endonuclease subunit S [Halomonas]MCC4289625.1 restriction endonuclease subunit S [Halomonas axialensis]MCF2913756.1 restriction endonuclease subunit S [Halomonas sp. Cn5-12]
MTFPKYPEYKDSGVEWLGEVPAHWEVVKLGYLAISQGGGTPPKDDLQYWNGNIPWVTPKDMKQQWITSTIDTLSEAALHGSPVSMIEPGHVLIVFRSGILRHRIPAAINQVPVTVNQDVRAYNVRPRLLPDFFLRLTQGLNRELLPEWSKQGATVESLDSELVNSTQLPVPPRGEQETIATFLDHETARIDALVEEQQRLIELLKEKRQAMISHAVTKGLDPNVPMKDSGVEWLGEVPAHWEITRVKHIVRTVEQGWSPQCENNPVESESEWGVLKVGCVNHGRFDSQENKKLPAALSPRLDLSIKAGDVLISRANTRELVGSCAVPTISYPNLMLSDKLFRLRLHETVADPRFLAFFIGASQTRQQIELEATGASSSMLNIGQSTVLEMPFPCPPLEEQAKIRDEVIKQTWSLLNLAGEALELKKRLEERRSALISAAVTGKIDVRGWQADQQLEQPEGLMAAEARATYG